MKQKFILFIVILIISQTIKAQSDFQKAYVITLDHDTLYGRINNGNYFHNSQVCEFIDDNTNILTQYAPAQLYGYRFTDGKFYISKEIEINHKPTILFMECLINGNLDIYFYQDLGGANHYYVSKDTLPLQVLEYKEKVEEVNGRMVIHNSNKYKGILHYYTYDCPELRNEISALDKPDHKNLINLASKYHYMTCLGEECIIYEKKIPRKLKMHFSGGITYFYETGEIAESVIYPTFGFDFMFQVAQRSEKLYVGLGVNPTHAPDSLFPLSIPLSMNFLNPRQGISPVFTYSFDLRSFCILQTLKVGVKYQTKKLSFILTGDIRTYTLYYPISSSLNVGIMYDLR